MVSASKTNEYFSEKEYKVAASPRVISDQAEVPAGGGEYKIGGAYTVKGKTYRPTDDPLYSATGLASWYGDAFHGRLTANGEVYDVSAITAAHPTMPLPSYARVTNLANNRSIIVRVNDRGPFAHDRIIDVSETVASMLDFKRAGTARVKVDYVGPAQMDGHDREMLMASYRSTGGDDGTLLALNQPRADRVFLSSAKPQRKAKPSRFDIFDEPAGEPAKLLPAAEEGDSLGPLILRNSYASSYVATDRFTKAAEATAEVGALAVVQLGVFGDRANAERAASTFSGYGKIVTADVTSGDRKLQAVRVVVDGRQVEPTAVVALAHSRGLDDAFVVSH